MKSFLACLAAVLILPTAVEACHGGAGVGHRVRAGVHHLFHRHARGAEACAPGFVAIPQPVAPQPMPTARAAAAAKFAVGDHVNHPAVSTRTIAFPEGTGVIVAVRGTKAGEWVYTVKCDQTGQEINYGFRESELTPYVAPQTKPSGLSLGTSPQTFDLTKQPDGNYAVLPARVAVAPVCVRCSAPVATSVTRTRVFSRGYGEVGPLRGLIAVPFGYTFR